MKVGRSRRRGVIVSVNAMSDIAFLLLIFIMLISLINYRQEIPIEYPEAENPEATEADKNVEIWITREGRLFHDGTQVDLRQVEVIIADAVAENPSVRVHVLADRATPYRHVNGVVEVLQLLQHRVVSFVVGETR
ncbi:MAG: ExbD/TolR family protein [bacterium]